VNDLKFAFRQLLKNPGFTAVAVLTLALGIGATTAIFSLINAALLRALPYPDADQLAAIWAEMPGVKSGLPAIPPANADVGELRDRGQSFAKVAAFNPGAADLANSGEPERVGAAGVTAGFFETLGVVPLLGRTLAPEDEAPGGSPVVLIGHGLWQRRFGGDPALLGKIISINGGQRTVIGILPAEFDFPRGAEWPAYFPFAGRTEVWMPLAYRATDDGSGWSNWQSRHERGLAVIARTKPGTSLQQAQAELDTFAARQANDHPETHKGVNLRLVPLREQLAGKSHRTLVILFAAVGLLLVIACVNVANLLLARAVVRQPEMALRAALGAGRTRLIRQLLTECALLAILGGGLGLLVASGCLKAFLALNTEGPSRLDEASLDPMVLGFISVVVLMASLASGLVPALQASRFDLRNALSDGGRGEGGAVRERVRGWLVVAEVALAVVLLTTAGLMVRSFHRVLAVQPGFRSDSVLAFDLNARPAAFFQQLTARLEALPGVRSAGAISYLPLGGGNNGGSFEVEGQPPVVPGQEPKTERRWVTPGYFAAMGIPLRRGRVFTTTDTADQPSVVVINQTLAERFFNARDPLGQRLKVQGGWRTIVGVVSDVKSASLESDVGPQVYRPHAQDPWPPMTVVLHTEGDPLALASAIRSEVKALDGQLPVAKMRTMEQVVSDATGARRFSVALLAFFAGSALLLTIMGIYGVVAFLVGRRRREIGVRVALGAQRGDILRLVLHRGMKPVALGGVAGLAGSLVASRLVASQLYGISASDPLTLASIVLLLALAALVACWLPARRAARVDPMEALRQE
jgi:putative ABC transport system permease protein